MSIDPPNPKLITPDPAHRRQMMDLKLQANKQRNGRKSYLAVLPPDLADYLQKCEFITSPEWDRLIPQFWTYQTERDWYIARQYTEVSWPKQVFELAGLFGAEYDAMPAYFYPEGYLPVFHTTFGWVRQHMEVLFQLVHDDYAQRLGVIATDSSAGIIISNYCGYVLDDPNPWETVYTVTTWKSRKLDLSIEQYSLQL